MSLINACVSHELRNPLNSIIAQNIQKSRLYEQLEIIIETFGDNTARLRKELALIASKLISGMKVQDASASLMRFLVQDFLDYV